MSGVTLGLGETIPSSSRSGLRQDLIPHRALLNDLSRRLSYLLKKIL